jgi:2-keto-4-pentenoate hydratase/2-oxohepta-3-ene-1,7-dioic acid hydratase in catechol pathway
VKIVGVKLSEAEPVFAGRLDEDGDQPTVLLLTDLQTFWSDPFYWVSTDKEATIPNKDSLPVQDVAIVHPVLPSARVLCIGLNYLAHAAEGSHRHEELPSHPTVFGRWTQSLTTGHTPVPVPSGESGLDWEGEIAAYVGKPLSDASAETARAAVIGFSTFNDLTARTAQKLTSQWTLGKNADRSGPLGPIVTADEVGDLRDGLRIQTRVNGTTVQDGNSRDMLFELGETLAHISRTLTLNPGDIICTGTPEGVGYARTPEWLLQPGDTVEVEVEKLGTLTSPIVSNNLRNARQ